MMGRGPAGIRKELIYLKGQGKRVKQEMFRRAVPAEGGNRIYKGPVVLWDNSK